MRQAYIRSCIRAEVRRARRDGRDPDRRHLRRETGLTSVALEYLISEITRDLVTAPPVASGAGQGPMRPGDRQNPTPAPTRRRTGPR
jgi:hypothetical protein